MNDRFLLALCLGGLLGACGASTQTRSLESFRIVSQSTDPATGQVVYHGVAEDGSGATVQILAAQGQGPVAVQAAPPSAGRATVRRRMHRRAGARRGWMMRHRRMRQRFAHRWRRFHRRDGRRAAHRGPHHRGCGH